MILKKTPVSKKWIVFSLVAVAVFMSTLDGSIVNVALPVIMQEFNVPIHTIEWVVVIYLLTVSSLLLSFGRLSDIKGRRWVYFRGFLVFSAGSFLCAIADSSSWLIVSRAFQGIGASMLMACSPALVVDIFPSNERGKALGMVGTVVAAGLTTGPPLGGFLIKTFSWNTIFYVNIPIGLAAAWVAFIILKGGHGDVERDEDFDWSGAIFLTITLVSFFLAIVKGFEWGFSSFITIGLLTLCFLAGYLLVLFELQKKYPVFDPYLLKVRRFGLPVLSALILFAALFTIVFLMPFYLVKPMGFSIDLAGYTMAIPFLCLFFISPISGTLSDRIGTRILCTTGMFILAVALFFLSRLTASETIYSVGWRLGLAGLGTAIFLPPNSSVVMSALSENRRGIASGTVATARNIGMMVGVAQAGLIFNLVYTMKSGGESLTVYTVEMEPYFMAAFQHAMLSGAIIACLGVVISFMRGRD